MRIRADENCDRLIVAALREAGHDVAYVQEDAPGAGDDVLFQVARYQGRILLTDDLDFGHLAELEHVHPPAIVLMRLDPLGRVARAERVLTVMGSLGEAMHGQLVIVEPGQLRLRVLSKT